MCVLMSALLDRAGHTSAIAKTGEEALDITSHRRPLLVILDVHLPGLSGYAVCRMLRDRFGDDLSIMFVSGERIESFDRVAGLLLGADDYLAKPFAPGEFLVRADKLLRRATRPASKITSRLTARELEVLNLLADGLGQKEIAQRLVISPKTVGTHIEHIMSKLGVRSRAQAIALLYREHAGLAREPNPNR